MEEKIISLVHLFWNLIVETFFVFVLIATLALLGFILNTLIELVIRFFEKKKLTIKRREN